jgi:hypothetical protein
MNETGGDNQFARALGNLEGKMDSMIITMERMANAFDSLEKGRLSRLEVLYATLSTEVAEKAKHTAGWTSTFISVAISVASAIIIYYFKGS